MEVRVLGPIEVSHAGQRISFARRQQSLILAILALEANHLVPRDRLLELLWGDRPPEKARAVVQTRISELRTILRKAATDLSAKLQTQGSSGYLLRIPAEAVDAHVFRLTMDQARQAPSDEQARGLLRDALGMWAGPAFGGWSRDDPFAVVCQGLEAARLAAAEELFDVELRLGNHRQVVDDIAELSAVHPTREKLVGQLMTALHRAGRSVEALQTYNRWRRWLADELGVDPGGELQALYVAILNGDAAFGTADVEQSGRNERDATSVALDRRVLSGSESDDDSVGQFRAMVPQILPPDIVDFSGRSHEAELLRAVVTGRSGGVTTASVTGQGGVGKTALSIHVAHQVSGHFTDGQLYINLRGADEDRPVEPISALGRFLHSLGVDDLPRTLEERVDLYRGLLAGRRILVVLDNAASEAQVLPLIPAGRDCAVIINSRVRLGATFGAHPIDLEVLPPSEADELLRRIAGSARVQAQPEAARELGRRCGFLPLALRIVAAKLATKPHWNIAKLVRLLEDEHDRLNQLRHGHLDVRATISLSFAGLDKHGQRLLRRLGDIDLPEVSVGLAAALLDAEVKVAEQVLEQLFDSQLIEVGGQDCLGNAQYRLHDLVRVFARERALVDESPGERDSARVRALGHYLNVADIAHRAIFGGDYLTVHGPAPRRPVDNGLAEQITADPVQWFEAERSTIVAAVHRAGEADQVDACWDLMCTISPFFPMRRYFDDWQSIADDALAVVQRAENRRGEAAVRYRSGMLRADRREHELAMEHFRTSAALFQELGDRQGRGIATAYIGMTDRFLGRMASAMRRYDEALADLRAAQDPAGQAFVLRSIGQVHLEQGDYAAADAYIEEALQLSRSLSGSRMGEAQVLFWQGMLRLKQRRYGDAEANFLQVLELMQALGDPRGQAQALRGLGIGYHEQGLRDKAAARLTEALQLVRQPRPGLVESYIRRTLDEVLAG